MKLIQNWKHAYRYSSMQLLMFAMFMDLGVTTLILIDTKFPFNPVWYVVLRLVLTGLAMGARLIAQQRPATS